MPIQGTQPRTKLVVTRRHYEGLEIKLEDGRTIDVVIERIAGSNVTVSVAGPPTVRFLRHEVRDRLSGAVA